MPWDGSENYQYPPGTPGIPDTTIESEPYNNFLDDLVNNDLNKARPISRGGTGATNAVQALINLGGEKSDQIITNYDQAGAAWLSGSFYSASTATASPVSGHAFIGFVTKQDDNNMVLEAYDLDSTPTGLKYTRIKKAGAWINSGAWAPTGGQDFFVKKSGDIMSGNLGFDVAVGTAVSLYGSKATKFRWEVVLGDAGAEGGSNVGSDFRINRFNDAGTIVDAPLIINRANGRLLVNGDPGVALGVVTKQYADAIDTRKVNKNGDTMTGALTLPGNPSAALQAAPKQYVDAQINAAVSGFLPVTGGTMVGNLVLNYANPTIYLAKTASGQGNALLGATGLQNRWVMYLGDGGAESGSNNGSDFALNAYTDAGGLNLTALRVFRSSGNLQLYAGLYVNGDIYAQSNTVRFAGGASYINYGSGFFQISHAILCLGTITSNQNGSLGGTGSGGIYLQNGYITSYGCYHGQWNSYANIFGGNTGFGCGIHNYWSSSGGYTGIVTRDSNGGGTGGYQFFTRDDGAHLGWISGTTGGVSYNTASDASTKENIRDAREVVDCLDIIRKLKVRHYKWRGYDKSEIGLVAQEVAAVMDKDNTVVSKPREMPLRDKENKENGTAMSPWGISYGNLAPYIIDAMQRMADEIDALKAR